MRRIYEYSNLEGKVLYTVVGKNLETADRKMRKMIGRNPLDLYLFIRQLEEKND